MALDIVGRDEELAAVQAFLDLSEAGPFGLVLAGEAGIGKSTLWLAGVEAAQGRGFHVLVSRPAEAERGLTHAGLGDLFEDVLERVLPPLPAPRRRALEIALLVEEGGAVAGARALAVAVRSGLELLAAEAPVVIAIDDVQWLDPSSASALAFALRRLHEQPVLLLLTCRREEGEAALDLERALGPERVECVPVGPLSVGATQQLLAARLGRTLARPILLRLHDASGGNPFYALELARALSVDVDPFGPLSVPETLEGLVRARLEPLPGATRQALVVLAVVGRPSMELLTRLGITDEVLDPARLANVIRPIGKPPHFTHPLFASVVYQGAAGEERRCAHARAAEVVEDPLDRVRHRALAAERPDPVIAADLDEASVLANGRGAPFAAADLAELALRLTPSDAHEELHRRAIATARANLAAGVATRARVIADDALAQASAGPARAEALVLLADLGAPLDRFVALLEEALGEAGTRPDLQALIHGRLATCGRLTNGLSWADAHARASLDLAETANDDVLRAGALAALSVLRFDLGDPAAPLLGERAFAAAVATPDRELRKRAAWPRAHMLMWSVDTERARAVIEQWHREWSESDELTSAEALWYLAWVELRAGRWSL